MKTFQELDKATQHIAHFVWASYNVDLPALLSWAYLDWDTQHPDYQEEKMDKLRIHGLCWLFTHIEYEACERLVAKISDRYKDTV